MVWQCMSLLEGLNKLDLGWSSTLFRMGPLEPTIAKLNHRSFGGALMSDTLRTALLYLM